MRTLLLSIALAASLAIPFGAAAVEQPAGDFFVSAAGNDQWSGRLAEPNAEKSDGPFATLARARDAVRQLKAQSPRTRPVQVIVRGGTYRLTEPVVFGPEDSGTAEAPVRYSAWPGETPVFSGGVPIGGWKRGEGPLWTTEVPGVKEGRWYFRQLFVDGKRRDPARLPNTGTFRAEGPLQPLTDREAARKDPAAKSGLVYREGDLAPWPDLDDAVVVVFHAWTTSRHHIAALDPKARTVRFTAPSGWPVGWWDKNFRYYVENVRAGLDAPGEWYLDRKSGVLSYYPMDGEDPSKAQIIAPVVSSELLRLEGDAAAGKFVEHLRFEGLSFQHADWSLGRDERCDGQAAAFLKTAAVFARGARKCVFERCEVAHVGGYALWLEEGCKENRVVQCHLHDLGGGGVRIGQMSLPEQEARRAERNEVYNSFIHEGGRVYHAAIGVWIGKSSYNTVHHNDICDFYYTGISVGWSWGYAPSSAHDNAIEFNHIYYLGQGVLSDLGGIYSLGIAPGTRLRNNLIHDVLSYDYGGWGIYPDEGSTDMLIENNVVYRTKTGGFHQHYGRENTVRNNVFALSAAAGQVNRTRLEPHRSFTFERNIVFYTQAPLLGGNWTNPETYRLDNNLYWNAAGKPIVFPGGLSLDQWQKKGQDLHSRIADPLFVDAAHDDFRLKKESPAWAMGFQAIDLSQTGLVGPAEWTELPKKIQRPAMVFPTER
ncbi:MAG: right-handed parallel beta-helix repeat-containing protein [Pirellulales bacterium]